ncbi:hypothetical protein BDN70DRAFT_901603 [Pholiota conissans]|uniref:Zn(2)-C6 fungal-type domain-containing protein n=1 Tax=Pholiota conissans TaxID=109636 RepID=A0A9P5YM40_9AGAR|nr:hypothetical protein BDN70DRAFT_901603 [Pholiota conissans]
MASRLHTLITNLVSEEAKVISGIQGGTIVSLYGEASEAMEKLKTQAKGLDSVSKTVWTERLGFLHTVLLQLGKQRANEITVVSLFERLQKLVVKTQDLRFTPTGIPDRLREKAAAMSQPVPTALPPPPQTIPDPLAPAPVPLATARQPSANVTSATTSTGAAGMIHDLPARPSVPAPIHTGAARSSKPAAPQTAASKAAASESHTAAPRAKAQEKSRSNARQKSDEASMRDDEQPKKADAKRKAQDTEVSTSTSKGQVKRKPRTDKVQNTGKEEPEPAQSKAAAKQKAKDAPSKQKARRDGMEVEDRAPSAAKDAKSKAAPTAAIDDGSDDDIEYVPPLKRAKTSAKGKGKKSSPDEDESSADEAEPSKKRKRASKTKSPPPEGATDDEAQAMRQRKKPVPVGTYNVPCSWCVNHQLICEKTVMEGSCVACKERKGPCDYAMSKDQMAEKFRKPKAPRRAVAKHQVPASTSNARYIEISDNEGGSAQGAPAPVASSVDGVPVLQPGLTTARAENSPVSPSTSATGGQVGAVYQRVVYVEELVERRCARLEARVAYGMSATDHVLHAICTHFGINVPPFQVQQHDPQSTLAPPNPSASPSVASNQANNVATPCGVNGPAPQDVTPGVDEVRPVSTNSPDSHNATPAMPAPSVAPHNDAAAAIPAQLEPPPAAPAAPSGQSVPPTSTVPLNALQQELPHLPTSLMVPPSPQSPSPSTEMQQKTGSPAPSDEVPPEPSNEVGTSGH